MSLQCRLHIIRKLLISKSMPLLLIKFMQFGTSLCISLYKLANECSDMNVYLWQVNDKPRKVYFRSINRPVLKQKHHLRNKIPMGLNL